MDVAEAPPADQLDADPKQQLTTDVERVRAERDDLDRQIAADRERLGEIRVALDDAVTAVWRDVFAQQQRYSESENIKDALTLGWLGAYQLIVAGCFVLAFAVAIFAFQFIGGLVAVGIYLALALSGYFIARDQCLVPLRKARASYLGRDGKDVRFVAFTRYQPGLNHPLIGFDGPTDGVLEDRAWKIPGVREKDALCETFIEVIDERRAQVLLTRFPDKTPTLVHADLENPFIRSYGVFFQRALERQIPKVLPQAESFREIAQHHGARRDLDARLRRMEEELREYDGTAAIVKGLALPATVRNKLVRHVMLYRLGDPAMRRGLFLIGSDRVDITDVVQTLGRASAATVLQLSFSQVKIGYVGQGAATVSRTFAAAKRARAIVFIDEAEKIFTTVTSAYDAMRKEVAQAIASEWDQLEDRTDVWVVAGANSREALDDAMLSRFGAIVDLAPPAPAQDTETAVVARGGPAPVVEDFEEDADVELPEPVVKRVRLLAAMFAHVETMESQGITVPRAVLILGPSRAARRTVIKSLADQTALPVVRASFDDVDSALQKARESAHAIVAVDIPEYGDPGSIAHLAIAIDRLIESKEPLFIVAETVSEDRLEPELRERLAECVDLRELDPETRRAKLSALLGGKPLDFDLDAELDELEARTAGMTEEHLRQFVDEASRKAGLRAIDAGAPGQVTIALDDFALRPAAEAATKADEAAL
jgi:AAA+ superfamily predicted ATPase